MDSEYVLPERFSLSSIPCLPRDVGGTGVEQCLSNKVKGQSVARCRAGYRITCDGGEEEGKVETASGSPDDDGTSGAIRSDSAYSYNITDGNPTQAGGQIAMDASGALSLQYDGAVFNKVIEGKFFLLQNAAHTELYLALSNDNKFSVKGMKKQHMRDESDSHWKYLSFGAIGGNCPPGCGDIVLQYYGNRFGPDPDQTPYYLVIEMTRERVPVFRIADQKVAKYCGRLGIIQH